jgi:Holliday junction resolvase
VVRRLRDDDWVAQRAPASLGVDVIALKAGETPRVIEVKSTSGGPYERFGPAERAAAVLLARMAGAIAELWWWPPRGQLRVIPETEWPS